MSFSGRTDAFLAIELNNDPFWPVINLGEFQKLHRIPSHYAGEAIEHQVELARGKINHQLSNQKSEWQGIGYATLAAIDAEDNGARATYYKAAIFYRAKAQLLRDFQTMSRRELADDQAKESWETYQTLLAESRRSIREILAYETSIDVELL